MKQKLQNILFVFLLGTIVARAQVPVITWEDFNPNAVKPYRQFSLATYATTKSIKMPDAGGVNEIWDYSGLIDTFYSNEIPYNLGKDSFPTANVFSTWFYNVTAEDYEKVDSTSWVSDGYIIANSSNYFSIDSVIRYKTPLPLLYFPITYKDRFTDSTVEYINSKLAYTIYDTIIADGYGKLILPNYGMSVADSNVLRVKTIRSYVSSNNSILNKKTISYSFYVNSTPYLNQLLVLDSIDAIGWVGHFYVGQALPLQISSFAASWQNKLPYLQWSAANTENTKAFNVQRSVDGNTFSNVGQVAASNTSTDYHFADNYTPTSTVYYRLQQIDKTGKFFYSNTLQLSVSSKLFTVFPNPSKAGSVHLSVPSGNMVVVMVYNIAGKLVYENKNFTATDVITTSNWSKGTYTVRIKDNDGWQVSSFEKE